MLVLLGALVVHELRYVLAGRPVDQQAHAYMGRLMPFACALVVLAAFEFLGRLALRRGARARAPAAGGMRWLALSCLLIGIFAVQEAAEMLIEHGRLELADSLIVHGSWLAAPLSFAVAALIAALLQGAKALVARTGTARRRPVRAREPGRALQRASAAHVAVIARNLAGRAPPSFVN